MKQSKLLFGGIVAVLALCLSPVFGNSADTEQTAAKASDCNIPAEFVDPEAMAQTMANPQKFMQFMVSMNSPELAAKMTTCSMDPQQWTAWTASMTNPTKWMNSMTPFMNPQMYMAPMNAAMNPASYMQWMTASMNPQMYSAPMQQMMNSSNYSQMFETMSQMPMVAQNSAQ